MLSLVTNLASDCGAGLCPGLDSRGGCLYVSKSKAPGKSARPTRAAPCSVKFLSQPYPLIFDGGFLPCRDVAQPGRALAWGARGRQFESARPDQSFFKSPDSASRRKDRTADRGSFCANLALFLRVLAQLSGV